MISFLWKRQLSSAVRAGIASTTFNRQNLEAILQLADDIHEDTKQASATVAAVKSSLDETQPAIPYANQEVAAVNRGRGRGGRGRGSGNRGRGGRGGGAAASGASATGTTPRHKGTKHPDLPAGDWKGCSMHFKWGRSAFFCSEPATCPWKDVFTPKQK